MPLALLWISLRQRLEKIFFLHIVIVQIVSFNPIRFHHTMLNTIIAEFVKESMRIEPKNQVLYKIG